MNQLACKFVDYLIVNEITPSDMRDVHVYTFEVLFGKVLSYGTLLILAIGYIYQPKRPIKKKG